MNVKTSKSHPRPGLPVVNLLSPASFDLIAARKLRRRFAAGAVVLVALIAGLWAVQNLRVGETEKVVAVERAETTRLNSETKMLLPVKAFVAGVAAQKETVQTTMSREIFFSEVVDGIQRATPDGASVESLGVTLAEAPAAGGTAAVAEVSPCPGPDPFQTRTVVGCVTLAGTAANRAEVGQFVIALGKMDLFVEPFISTTTAADSTVSFSGSVGLSQAVFSKRYGKPLETGAGE